MKVHEAITEVMRSVPVVKKEDRNASQNFNFRGIDGVLNAVGPAMRKHGLVVLPSVVTHDTKSVTTRSGAVMNFVTLLVKYTFVGPEGDTMDVLVPGESADAGDKAYSKAMSVALRTALLQTLSIPTDEKDPDSETIERASSQTTARERTAPPARTAAKRSPKTEADIARDDLLAKVKALSLDTKDVAKLYLADAGTELGKETDSAKIADFTERLEPAK